MATIQEQIGGIVEPFPRAREFLTSWPDSGCFLLTGPSGVGKSVLALQFINDALLAGKKVVVVHTNAPSETLMEQSKSMSFDLQEAKERNQLVFVDVYSGLTGRPSSSQNVIQVRQGANLADVVLAIEKILEQTNDFCFVLDDITSLLPFSSSGAAYRFTHGLVSKLRVHRARGLFIAIPHIMDSKIERLFPSLFDGHMEMKRESGEKGIKRLFRLRFVRGVSHKTNWVEFNINKGGVHFEHESRW